MTPDEQQTFNALREPVERTCNNCIYGKFINKAHLYPSCIIDKQCKSRWSSWHTEREDYWEWDEG